MVYYQMQEFYASHLSMYLAYAISQSFYAKLKFDAVFSIIQQEIKVYVMMKPMFGHRPKPKQFDLPLRYYNPEEDEKKTEKAIKFQTHNRVQPKQFVRVFFLFILLSLVVYLIVVMTTVKEPESYIRLLQINYR